MGEHAVRAQWKGEIFGSSSRYTLIDPNADEERLMDGFLAISMNEHKEICGIQMGGALGLKREQVSSWKLWEKDWNSWSFM